MTSYGVLGAANGLNLTTGGPGGGGGGGGGGGRGGGGLQRERESHQHRYVSPCPDGIKAPVDDMCSGLV